MVQLRISVEGPDDGTLAALYRWLARDPDLAHTSRISPVSARPAPGEQGGTLEAINAIVTDATALGGLVMTVLTYRGTRRRGDKGTRGSVRLELDGAIVTIEPGSEVSAEEIVGRLLKRAGSVEGAGSAEGTERP